MESDHPLDARATRAHSTDVDPSDEDLQQMLETHSRLAFEQAERVMDLLIASGELGGELDREEAARSAAAMLVVSGAMQSLAFQRLAAIGIGEAFKLYSARFGSAGTQMYQTGPTNTDRN